MRITSKGRYAVLAMVDVARHSSNSHCNLTDVSIRQNISLPYLERIFNDLKKADLVESQKGPGGGYRLSKDSNQIQILEIFNAIDEKIKATGCSNNPNEFCTGKGTKCLTHGLWHDLENLIGNYLKSVSLNDLINGNSRVKDFKI
tara:strand:+ start:302 stop:736 length:435 start_codon:yes stop_codon:yes gene_type:complete